MQLDLDEAQALAQFAKRRLREYLEAKNIYTPIDTLLLEAPEYHESIVRACEAILHRTWELRLGQQSDTDDLTPSSAIADSWDGPDYTDAREAALAEEDLLRQEVLSRGHQPPTILLSTHQYQQRRASLKATRETLIVGFDGEQARATPSRSPTVFNPMGVEDETPRIGNIVRSSGSNANRIRNWLSETRDLEPRFQRTSRVKSRPQRGTARRVSVSKTTPRTITKSTKRVRAPMQFRKRSYDGPITRSQARGLR